MLTKLHLVVIGSSALALKKQTNIKLDFLASLMEPLCQKVSVCYRSVTRPRPHYPTAEQHNSAHT